MVVKEERWCRSGIGDGGDDGDALKKGEIW